MFATGNLVPRCCLLLLLSACGPPAEDEPPEALGRALPLDTGCPDPDSTGVKLVAPASGAYHGVFLPMPFGKALRERDIRDFEGLAGRHVAWVYFDNPWGDGGRLDLRFPAESVRAIWRTGAVPFIRFSPWTTH